MESTTFARAEMTTVIAEPQFKKGTRSKLLPASQYHFKSGDSVQINNEENKHGVDELQL